MVNQRIEDLEHRHELLEHKRAARAPKMRDRLLAEIAGMAALCTRLGEFRSFAIGKTGLRIDLSNHVPHAMQSLEAQYLVKYSTLAGTLKTSGPITRLVPKK